MTREERLRRLVDGELDALEKAALMTEAEQDPALASELAGEEALREALTMWHDDDDATAPADLVDRAVRRAVLERARDEEAATHGFGWFTHWLVRPRAFHARPAALLLAATALVLLTLSGARWASRHAAGSQLRENMPKALTVAHEESSPSTSPRTNESAAEVPVRFVLPASGAHSVVVAGDFNEWRTDATPLVDDDGDGVFVGTVNVARGTYDYMFVVDGERWVPDPYASQYHDDGFGQRNAVLRLD